MRAQIARKIRTYLHSNTAPDFLFQWYFDRQGVKKQKILQDILDGEQGLMEQLSAEEKAHWRERINLVKASPDNAAIPRAVKAGQLVDKMLVMHNDLRIDPLSYYNYPLLQMLLENKGVHEPQEEKIFQRVMQSLAAAPPKTMLELGSYWCFYSMWFMQYFSKARCVMVEPHRSNLYYGKRNLQLNGMSGTFLHAGISKTHNKRQNLTTVDHICKTQGIDFLDILHSDIQGYELDMLHGSERMLSTGKVGYAFISTHSDELHYQCQNLLTDKYGFQMVASADLKETYSWDGILVMKAPDYPGLAKVDISKRKN